MKKTLIVLLFITSVFKIYPQNMRIIYGANSIYSKEELEAIKDPNVRANIISMSSTVGKVEFELLINKDYAQFNVIDKLKEDGYNQRAVAMVASNSVFSYDVAKNTIIQEKNLAGNDFYVQYNIDTTYKWEITTESKTINNYVCYKATTTVYYDNFRGKGSYGLEAWFCPAFPYKYGPDEYFGLPGLVFEARQATSKTRLYVKKIEILKEPPVIKFPTQKTITPEKFTQIFNDEMNKLVNQRQ